MRHPQRAWLAAVFGANGQGSGYLLTPWRVLTAAHVLGESGTAVVIVPGGHGRVECRVSWQRYEEDCDAAICPNLRVLGMVADPASVDPAHLAPLHGCQVIVVPPSVIESAPKPA